MTPHLVHQRIGAIPSRRDLASGGTRLSCQTLWRQRKHLLGKPGARTGYFPAGQCHYCHHLLALEWHQAPAWHGAGWMFCAIALVPILLLVLHPKVFYGLMNAILRRVGKPQMTRQLSFKILAGLLLWAAIGLVWQGLTIWVLTAAPLGLEFTKWWIVAGAYSLAWCAGFLAVWAPGGMGVREVVFIAAMRFVLPERVRQHFDDPKALLGFLAFLSVLLRLWATLGELLLAGWLMPLT